MAKIPDPLALTLDRVLENPPDAACPVLLAGPTASGKSALALALARAQGRVIVNADALQVYDMWRILSARPDGNDCAQVPHYLYGTVTRGQDWSVGHWLRAAAKVLEHHRNAIIVGGTGLYFRALTEGLVEIPPIPAEIRRKADMLRDSKGADFLLGQLDPQTRGQIDVANPARVQRAWEVLMATGTGLAAWQAQTPPPLLPLSQTTALVMRPDVGWLNERIDSRFATMMEQGALQEARDVLPYWSPHAPWAKAIGAPELIAHLHGHISLSQAQEAATLATRQYAKRQRTWFRNRMKGWTALDQ
jgi:tRNA dimethylallyltransferase